MKLLGNSSFSDKPIIAGENSVPGVISLITSCEDENIKQKLKLDQNSNVLVIGCEGDTDKEMYQKLISQN
jgi:diaminopropionate ammonia-lyase